MVRKQEEVARSMEHKTVTLVSVEELSVKIEEKVKKAKEANDVTLLISTLDEVFNLVTDFIDFNKDKVEMSLIADVQKDIDNLQVSKKELEAKLEKVNVEEKGLSNEYNKLKNEIEREKDSNRDAEKAVFRIMAESGEVRSKLHDIAMHEENLRLVKEDFKRELTELGVLLGTHILQFNTVHIDNFNEDRHTQEERRKRIEKIKIRLEDSGGGGGAEIMKEYTDATERDNFLEKELTDLQNSATSLGLLIVDLDLKLSTEFKTGVEKINNQFKEYFAMMFGGGEAKLEVSTPVKKRKDTDLNLMMEDDGGTFPDVDSMTSEDASLDGIEIEVSLPKKKVKGLMMLSGGERALTSIALLFAISQVNPPPFIILDETDAALDEANSKKYADMIENLSKYSQLIVITHNRETMSRAGILYGVTMGAGGGSKLLSVAFEEAVSVAK